MSLFDNAFNINVNNVRDIQIVLVNFTYWPTDGPKCSGNISQNVTHLAIHTKLPAFKTVIAMTLLWNRAQGHRVSRLLDTWLQLLNDVDLANKLCDM